MSTVCIIEQPIEVKEWQGQRVVTFKDIDRVHRRPEGTARKRFCDNHKHFIANVDYFKISSNEIHRNSVTTISPAIKRSMMFLTESGYLMLVKSFTDDLA